MVKQAVVFIVDSYPTMNKPLQQSSSSDRSIDSSRIVNSSSSSNVGSNHGEQKATTRLSCAKNTVEYMVSNLMIQSKTNEVGIIVLKTKSTKHHLVPKHLCQKEEKDLEKYSSNKDDIPFPNITELTTNGGVTRPTIDLLRKISNIECSCYDTNNAKAVEEAKRTLRGDICDGIVVATNALYQRTYRKKYDRKIILLTDAEHDMIVDINQILVVVDSLRSMDCRLEVVGIDFTSSATFMQPIPAPIISSSADIITTSTTSHAATTLNDDNHNDENSCSSPIHKQTKTMKEEEKEEEKPYHGDSSGTNTSRNTKFKNENYNNDNNTIFSYSSKEDREKFLISLTEKTGGSVISASTMEQVSKATLGKRIIKAAKRKVELRIAPGIVLDENSVRYSLIQKRSTLPRLKKEAVLINNENQPILNGLGHEVTGKVTTITTYWDNANKPDAVEFTSKDRTKAVQFGSDLIPIGELDMEGFKENTTISSSSNKNNISKCHIQILGYMDRTRIPKSYLIGPPYALYGHESKRASTIIKVLARSLYQTKRVGICTFVKSKGSDPILGGLFPLEKIGQYNNNSSSGDDDGGQCNNRKKINSIKHLVFLRLPFAEDVNTFAMKNFDEYLLNNKSTEKQQSEKKCCDELIDFLLLPDDELCSENIPNPCLRSFHKTIIKRAIDPQYAEKGEVVSIRDEEEDLMVTPSYIIEEAKPKLNTFRTFFPRKDLSVTAKNGSDTKSTKSGKHYKKDLTYRDFL